MSQKLEITKIETVTNENIESTNISWSRLDTEKEGWGDFGTWTVEGVKTQDEVVAYAKTMVDPGIEVILNIQEDKKEESIQANTVNTPPVA